MFDNLSSLVDFCAQKDEPLQTHHLYLMNRPQASEGRQNRFLLPFRKEGRVVLASGTL